VRRRIQVRAASEDAARAALMLPTGRNADVAATYAEYPESRLRGAPRLRRLLPLAAKVFAAAVQFCRAAAPPYCLMSR